MVGAKGLIRLVLTRLTLWAAQALPSPSRGLSARGRTELLTFVLKITKPLNTNVLNGFVMVGAKGFEPPTPWSQTRCATRLRYAPTMVCYRTQGAVW
jgi:hypothetical protein